LKRKRLEADVSLREFARKVALQLSNYCDSRPPAALAVFDRKDISNCSAARRAVILGVP
jgi:hypothetical protein